MENPLLVYDGDCGFCRRWVRRLQKLTGDRVAYAPYQEVADQYPQITREAFEQAVQLIEYKTSHSSLVTRHVSSGAEAVFRALATHRFWKILLWKYRYLPGFRPFSEWVYRLVARHRGRTTCASPRQRSQPPGHRHS